MASTYMSMIQPKKDSVMNELLESKQYFNLPKTGELVTGKIIAIDNNAIHVDLGGVATGVVRGRERYADAEQYKNLAIGDTVEATVLELENENGEVELSFQYAGRQKAWQTLRDYVKSGEIISATITEANKGGLLAKVDTVAGFLPVSQLAPEHYPRIPGGDKNRIYEILKSYVGKKFDIKVIDANEDEDKLIISEKAAWEETQRDVINKYKVGMIVEGVVTAVTDFGVFVEFDDKLEGLIHISEIAWQRIDNPHNFVKVGQKVQAEIISIENSKIFLSMKKLENDPWVGIEKKFEIGQKVSGTIIKVNPFGLFVELGENIQGLAHVSQLSDKPVKDPSEIAKEGEKKDFYVVSLDSKNHRLGLSLVKPDKAEKIEKTATEEAPKEATETEAKEAVEGEEQQEKKETKKRGRKPKSEKVKAEEKEETVEKE
jgi:small subunit ribosomal protein S1